MCPCSLMPSSRDIYSRRGTFCFRLKLSLLHGENAERGVLQCISDTVGGARGDAAMPRERGLGTPHDLCGFVCRTKIICALKFLILVYTAFLYGSVPLYTHVK